MNYAVADERLFHDRPTGSSRVAWGVALAARDAGHRVAYLCGADPDGPPPGRAEVDGVTVVRYQHPLLARWNPLRLRAHVRAATAAAATLADVSWDVVHGHTLVPGLAAFAALGGGAHRIVTIHSPVVPEQRIVWADGTTVGALKLAVGEPLLLRTERRYYTQADTVTALSQFTRRQVTAFHGRALRPEIRVLPFWPGVEAASISKEGARERLGWARDARIAFTVRRLVRRMGIDTLVDALHALPPGLELTVYIGGEGPEADALRARAATGPGHHRIRFLGRMSDEEVALAYAAADLFVLPSRALECFGIIAVEALAAGVPVMASRAGALPEVVGPVLPELMFDPGDSVHLAQLLAAFARGELALPSPTLLRAYARERFGRERLVRAYLDLIERVPPEVACAF
jgi:glycosyltransferase involved in cell wall biosynthesis